MVETLSHQSHGLGSPDAAVLVPDLRKRMGVRSVDLGFFYAHCAA
jgi:hypothetical protein